MKMKAAGTISRAGRGRFLSAKRSVRQMLSFALAFAMLASLLPGTALAADVEHTGHDGWTALSMGTNYIALGGAEQSNNTLSGGKYYLSGSMTLIGGDLTIADGADVTLCLSGNGHELNVGSYRISIPSGASLTICDCDTNGSLGCITGANSSGTISNQGTLTLASGGVNNTQSGSSSCAIYNYGTFCISGSASVNGSKYGIYNSGSSANVYLSGSPYVNALTAGIYNDSFSSKIWAHDGTETQTPVTVTTISVQSNTSSSPYLNGETAVYGVSESNQNCFTSGNTNYTLKYDSEAGTLIYQGESQNLTWLDADGTTPLTGDSYPGTAEYGAYFTLPTPNDPDRWFLGWKSKITGSSFFDSTYANSSVRITNPMTFQLDSVTALSGSGTEEDPYQITSADELAALAQIVNNGNSTYNNGDTYYALANDIDLGSKEWTPIGDSSNYFKSKFDGQNHTISGLSVSGGYSSNCGLFGYLSYASVSNLKVSGAVSGYARVGMLAGYSASSSITNCTVSGAVQGDDRVGMLAGHAYSSTITGCTASGTVQGDSNYGALVGYQSSLTESGNDTSGCTVTPLGYTTDGNQTMAYEVSDSTATTVDVKGNYKGNWIQTTYNNNGYTVDKTGLTGATITAEPKFLNNGQYIQLNYTVTAGSSAITGGNLAVYADVKIGDNDYAAIEAIQQDGKTIGLRMVDTHSNYSGCVSENAQFNLYFAEAGGVTAVSTYWFGYYSYKEDNAFKQIGVNSTTENDSGYNSDYTSYSGSDSGLAFSWQGIELAAGESRTFSVILGVGEKSDPPQWGDYPLQSGAATPVVALSVAENAAAFQVKAKVQDAVGQTDTLYYSVETEDGIYNGKSNEVLGSVEADGTMKEIANTISTTGYPAGTYTFRFWLSNTAGAASSAVSKTIKIGENGAVDASSLDALGEDVTPETYAITKAAAEKGSFTVSAASAAAGAAVTITPSPDSGYAVASVAVTRTGGTDAVDVAAGSGGTYAFTMPAYPVTVTVRFTAEDTSDPDPAPNPGSSTPAAYPPIIRDTAHGSVTVSPKNPQRGDRVTITVKPDAGYEIAALTVTDRSGNAVAVTDGADGVYTFTQPAGKVTIEVTFREMNQTESCPQDDTCPMARFADLALEAWYHDGVHYCLENGLMVGAGANAFSPDAAASRGMIATILWRTAGSPAVDYLMAFDDADAAAYYGEAVRWAAGEGVVDGYGDGRFGPDTPITREELATMLYRYAGSPAASGEHLAGFADADEVSGWAADAMSWAVANGVINGRDGLLAPRSGATRAEMAAMLMRFCENIIK